MPKRYLVEILSKRHVKISYNNKLNGKCFIRNDYHDKVNC